MARSKASHQFDLFVAPFERDDLEPVPSLPEIPSQTNEPAGSVLGMLYTLLVAASQRPGVWLSIPQMERALYRQGKAAAQTAISARLREIRSRYHATVLARQRVPGKGLWEYRLGCTP